MSGHKPPDASVERFHNRQAFLDVNEFARICGVSPFTLQKMGATGQFRPSHPGKGRGNVNLYSISQIEGFLEIKRRGFKLPRLPYTGEHAQKVFAILDAMVEEGGEGAISIRKIVKETSLHPDVVKVILDEWTNSDGFFFVRKDATAFLADLFGVDILNESDLIDAVKDVLEKSARCDSCKSADGVIRTVCPACDAKKEKEQRKLRACVSCKKKTSSFCRGCVKKLVAKKTQRVSELAHAEAEAEDIDLSTLSDVTSGGFGSSVTPAPQASPVSPTNSEP